MEKYLALIFIASPGFIAYAAGSLFGMNTTNKGEFHAVMRYFLFSIFSVFLFLLLSCLFGFVDITKPWTSLFTDIQSTASIMAMFFSLSLVSVFVGGVWAIYGRKWLLCLANLFNLRISGRTKFSSDKSLFYHLFFNDKEYHFVIVYKTGEKEPFAIGFCTNTSEPDGERTELGLTTYSDYWEEFNRAKSDASSPLNKTIQTYIDVTNGLTIVETAFPPHWAGTANEKDEAAAV